jgi:hypothetical protein
MYLQWPRSSSLGSSLASQRDGHVSCPAQVVCGICGGQSATVHTQDCPKSANSALPNVMFICMFMVYFWRILHT